MRVFWDVDTQVDFIMPEGKLYVPGAETIVSNLGRLTDHAHAVGIRIIASADDHVEGHEELSATPDFERTFPLHCMRGTPGQQRIAQTQLHDVLVIEPDAAATPDVRRHGGDILFNKHFFDVFTNGHVDPVITALGVTSVVLYGVALDVCNRFAIEGLLARRPQIALSVVEDAVRALNVQQGEALLAEWMQRGVEVIGTDQALALQPDTD